MTEHSENTQPASLTYGLAFIAGGGLTLMVVAAGVGVVQGENATSGLVSVLFGVGAAALLIGIIAWFAVVQPHKHFDDINVPMDTGHHDDH